MTVITEVPDSILAENHKKRLIRYNIRSIEQFLSRAEDGGVNLATSLGIETDELKKIVDAIKKRFPAVKAPKSSGNDYGLGYRTKSK